VFNALVVFGALTLLIGGQEGIRPVKAGSKYCQGFCFETNGGKKTKSWRTTWLRMENGYKSNICSVTATEFFHMLSMPDVFLP